MGNWACFDTVCLTEAALLEEPTGQWSELPRPLIHLIFSHLDAQALALAACVHKEWQSVASDEQLWNVHLKEAEACLEPSTDARTLYCNLMQAQPLSKGAPSMFTSSASLPCNA